jgi:Myristoyl-CoA:protein N-myristoyltransferase, C-terminal domain
VACISRHCMHGCKCCHACPTHTQTPSTVASQVKQLLDDYLAQFTLAPVLSEAELAHALLPSDDVVSSYVVAAEGECLHDVTGQCAALQCVAEMLLCSKCPWSCGGHMGHCLPCSSIMSPNGLVLSLQMGS